MEKRLIVATVVFFVVLAAGAALIFIPGEVPTYDSHTATTSTSETSLPKSSVAQIETRINQGASALGIKITPLEVLEDSRCPEDVQCVWAGQVRVRARVLRGLGPKEGYEQEFTLGKTIRTEAEKIILAEVKPGPISEVAIPTASYRFTFEIAGLTDVK